ncbi:VanZ family protein [Paenibacillus chitinolyticus]|uniref:VanZ family protein n=1 Tax=Paenibacillus TaxID=44249 RepID=UPI001C30DCA1|nr:VanZ family protein [Paenibacillus sp. GbtcB18]
MFKFYLFPISYAFLTFPIAAVLFTLPFLIVQYRKYGYVHYYRALLLYLFLLYMMNAVFLIILPLPPSIHNTPPAVESYAQWIPFHFLEDILKETAVVADQPRTYLHLLKERAFLQVFFNVLLTVPFGIFLRYYFRTSWVKCLLFSIGLSLFFEITQVTGLYGIYDYPYRLFDVDDIMMNTAGGMIGYVAAEWLSSLLPKIESLDDKVDLAAKRVTYTRRGLAFLFDWFVMSPVLAILTVLNVPLPYAVGVVLYFIVLPYFWNGQTLGKWIVRIRLTGKSDKITLYELFVRYGLLYLFVGGLNQLYIRAGIENLPDILMVIATFAMFLFNAWFAIHVLRCVFNRNRQLFYEKKSGTRHVIK